MSRTKAAVIRTSHAGTGIDGWARGTDESIWKQTLNVHGHLIDDKISRAEQSMVVFAINDVGPTEQPCGGKSVP